MQIRTSDLELTLDDSPLRVYVAQPKADGQFPALILFSEIFGLTAPILRAANRLAGHGYVVAAPEIYHRLLPPGTAIAYDDPGRMWGNDCARRTTVAQFDATTRATLDALATHPAVSPGRLGAIGFCIGGHLALRAALDPRIKATTAAYPTGVHTGKLGHPSQPADTLARLPTAPGQILVALGESDPHVPPPARDALTAALTPPRHRLITLPGEHAFMRDEGPRYDPAAADTVYAAAIELFAEALV